jgi:hypothetical protein
MMGLGNSAKKTKLALVKPFSYDEPQGTKSKSFRLKTNQPWVI